MEPNKRKLMWGMKGAAFPGGAAARTSRALASRWKSSPDKIKKKRGYLKKAVGNVASGAKKALTGVAMLTPPGALGYGLGKIAQARKETARQQGRGQAYDDVRKGLLKKRNANLYQRDHLAPLRIKGKTRPNISPRWGLRKPSPLQPMQPKIGPQRPTQPQPMPRQPLPNIRKRIPAPVQPRMPLRPRQPRTKMI